MTKLGFIYPLGGAEFEYYRFAEKSENAAKGLRTYLVGARIFGEGRDHDIDQLQKTGSIANLEEATRGLVPLAPNSVVWACTSGSFVDGRDHALRQADAITRVAGCPASSTSLAFVAAMRTLGAGKAALVGSYPEPATRAFVRFLAQFNIEVPELVWLDAPAGPDAARFGTEKLVGASERLNMKGIDVVLVPDTAMPGFEVVERLEAKTGIPALSANQVTIWEGLRLAGQLSPMPNYGSLFAGSGTTLGWD